MALLREGHSRETPRGKFIRQRGGHSVRNLTETSESIFTAVLVPIAGIGAFDVFKLPLTIRDIASVPLT
ncbi:MAG: hypothetical protein KDB01_08800 [Planctomycetaceae bacterium]|nr:hypothetical protein [Planctomycetaceae bacterium]